MNAEELWHAWAAGFVDGEGALMLTRQMQSQVLIHVRVGQAVRAPLDRLVMMYGGSVKKKVQGNKPYFEWNIYGGKAVSALRLMRPYMMVKGAHADLIDEYFLNCGGKPAAWEVRMDYHNRMSLLQTKGQHLRKVD